MHTTVWETDSSWEAAVQHRELSSPRSDLEGGTRWDGKEAQEWSGYLCTELICFVL